MQFPPVNRFSNEEARNAFYASFAVFGLWWVFILLSGLLGGLFRRRTPPVSPANGPAGGAAAAPPGHEGALHRITSALRDVFISSFAVVVFNYLVNGITRTFNIWHWVVIWIGVIWAVLRGPLHRFADIIMLLVIAGFVFLWVNGFRHVSYVGDFAHTGRSFSEL